MTILRSSSNGVSRVTVLVAIAILTSQTAAKNPKKSWKQISSIEELLSRQNEVLLQAAGLGKTGDLIGAAELLKEFTRRVQGISSSGAIGGPLVAGAINSMVEACLTCHSGDFCSNPQL